MKRLKEGKRFKSFIKWRPGLKSDEAKKIILKELVESAEAEGYDYYTVGAVIKSSGNPNIKDSYSGWELSILAYRE